MGQHLVTCIQEVNPTPMLALALCIHMYFPCTMFYKKFTNLSAVFRPEGVGHVLPACRLLWGGCGRTDSHLAWEINGQFELASSSVAVD